MAASIQKLELDVINSGAASLSHLCTRYLSVRFRALCVMEGRGTMWNASRRRRNRENESLCEQMIVRPEVLPIRTCINFYSWYDGRACYGRDYQQEL
ncbi:hypothetical protein BDZ89DRAFT_1062815 [Hymenopellis radicata]|nr:hypothetical protein BDZ89DRAFT_1062815 [Hymenopellis radicata]